MLLKATEQSDTGLNTKSVNVESGRTVTLKHAMQSSRLKMAIRTTVIIKL